MTRIFTTWLPGRERERAQAILWLSSRWGGALTPLLVAYILQFMSWRRAFELFGALGVIWAVAFYRWYRDDPSEHRSVNRAELAMLPPTSETAAVAGHLPWRLLVSKPVIWLLCARSTRASAWLVVLRDLAAVLSSGSARDGRQDGCAARRPAVAARRHRVPDFRRAHPADRARDRQRGARPAHHRDRRVPRRVRVDFHFHHRSGSGEGDARSRMAGLFNDFVMPAAWAGCMDIGGRYAGTVSGAMNMFGSIAGALSPLVVGYLLSWTSQNWTLTFYVSAAIYSLGAICWLFLDAHTPLEAPVVGRRAA